MNDQESNLAVPALGSALRNHYTAVVLPIWCGPGFNANLQLPFEAVAPDSHAPLPPSRYRALVCARQLFVFSRAGNLGHADRLFASLRHYFYDKQYGGWFYSVNALGAPKERQKDLYTHAFVIFACAEYARRSGSQDALALLDETASLVDASFGVAGLLNAVMAEDFSTVLEMPLQNPLMHLTEAWLAAREVTGDLAFDRRLQALATSISQFFVNQPTGCISELPSGASGNRLEPGHQFEWYVLAFGSGHPVFEAAGLCKSLARAFDFAEANGVDPWAGGVCAALDEQGAIRDSTQRIWAQSEYLRALAAHGSDAARERLPRQIERFQRRFLHPRGWIECQSAEGVVTRADMPSSTPYHLATAYDALP